MGLPEEVRLDVYDAVMEYAISGKLSDLKPMAKVAFGFIKQTIDRDTQKYMSVSETRRKAGEKGAAARWQTIANDSKNSKCHPNDNVNDNKETSSNEEVKKPPSKKPPDFDFRKNIFMNDCAAFVEMHGQKMIREFFDYWTEPNKSKTKMRFELEKTWDLSRRLKNWSNNDLKFNKNGTANSRNTKPTVDELAAAVELGIGLAAASGDG